MFHQICFAETPEFARGIFLGKNSFIRIFAKVIPGKAASVNFLFATADGKTDESVSFEICISSVVRAGLEEIRCRSGETIQLGKFLEEDIIRLDFFSDNPNEESLLYIYCKSVSISILEFNIERRVQADGDVEIVRPFSLDRNWYENVLDPSVLSEFQQVYEKFVASLAAEADINQSDIIEDILSSRIGLDGGHVSMWFPLVDVMMRRLPVSEGLPEAVLARIIAQALSRHDEWLPTANLTFLSHFLNTKGSIRRTIDFVNAIFAGMGLGKDKFVISKHTINPRWLTSAVERRIEGVKDIFAQFESLGVKLMLGYGTLLGAARDGAFIPHDDDVDMLYLTECDDMQTMELEREELCLKLSNEGYTVRRDDPMLVHFTLDGRGASADIFPCWLSGGNAYLVMEQYRVRSIRRDIVDGEKNAIILHGASFPCPTLVNEFLTERYGADWRVADPFFEWPWEVS